MWRNASRRLSERYVHQATVVLKVPAALGLRVKEKDWCKNYRLRFSDVLERRGSRIGIKHGEIPPLGWFSPCSRGHMDGSHVK